MKMVDVNTIQRQCWIKNGAPRTQKTISNIEVVFIGMIVGVFLALGVAHHNHAEEKENEMTGFAFEKSESNKRKLAIEKQDNRPVSDLGGAMPTERNLAEIKKENARRFERRRAEQARQEFVAATKEVYHF